MVDTIGFLNVLNLSFIAIYPLTPNLKTGSNKTHVLSGEKRE
jgi:hypothetical protein